MVLQLKHPALRGRSSLFLMHLHLTLTVWQGLALGFVLLRVEALVEEGKIKF